MVAKSKGGRAGPCALIVDDEAAICAALSGLLEDEGWQTTTASSGRQAIIEYKLQLPDIVFLDVWMPGMDGIETLQMLKEISADIPIVIMSGHATIDTAVRTTKLGAFDFLEKPLSFDKILPMIEHALTVQKRRLDGTARLPRPHEFIGAAASLETIKKQLKVVAPRNAWVLITGENGTGKEVLARNIHLQSPRAARPFVAVNCAAIPEDLIESELFGHVKGAFTGAVATQRGKFELAHQGTLFLDEIGDMSLRTQAKMLRVLQEHQFERLGDHETVKVDVRVIAATNKNLKAAIDEGSFREDLFYRLNVVPFHLAPLREREGDVGRLVGHFLTQLAQELGEERKQLAPATLALLESYPWPGNVRELRNLIERLCIMVPSRTIQPEDLPENIFVNQRHEDAFGGALPAPTASLKAAKSDFERAFILGKLQENHGNISKTAEAIGIERSNLHRKLRTYNIDTKRLKE